MQNLIRIILSIPILNDVVLYFFSPTKKMSRAVTKVQKIIGNNKIDSITIKKEEVITTSLKGFQYLESQNSIVAAKGDLIDNEIEMISPSLSQKKNFFFFDIGANCGEFRFNIANKFRAKVYSFEPSNNYYPLLLKNIQLNKNLGNISASNINPYQLAFSNISGKGKIKDKKDNLVMHQSAPPPPPQKKL